MEPNIITHVPVAQVVQPDGSIVTEWALRETPLVLEHHDVYHEREWVSVRAKRDSLLTESDWVAARSVETGTPVPADWLAYRQALRDITTQRNPFQVVWPTKPK
jgi:hypothetical protein